MTEKNLGAIILAAGKGSRMQSTDSNKVTLLLNNKPVISHVLEVLESMNISPIIVVIGFAKESVKNVINNPSVIFAEQHEQLGTGHAVVTALEKVPDDVYNVIVLQGDDSFFYNEKLLSDLAKEHTKSGAVITFLTIEVDNPKGLGRIVRNNQQHVIEIVEERDATEEQKRITEINPACYLFSVAFLKKYLPEVKKSPKTGEYYLTSLIDIAIKHNEKIATVQAGKIPWRGINTKEELVEAEALFTK